MCYVKNLHYNQIYTYSLLFIIVVTLIMGVDFLRCNKTSSIRVLKVQ